MNNNNDYAVTRLLLSSKARLFSLAMLFATFPLFDHYSRTRCVNEVNLWQFRAQMSSRDSNLQRGSIMF